MKYTFFYLLILIFFVSSNLTAQQPQLVLLTPSANIPQSDQFELLDLTGDSLVLGYLQTKDGGNERQAIVTPIEKGAWLKATTANKAASSFSTFANPVLYVLNDISVGRTGSANYVRLKATVYEKEAKGYTLLKTVDTFITDKAKDINSVGDLINTAISSTASELKSAMGQKPLGKALTMQEVIKHEQEKYAFIRKGINPTGIYMSYEEFKANKPSFRQFFIKTNIEAKTIAVNSFTETDSTLRPVTPWAVAVHNELYVYHDNKLYPVEAVGNNLVFSKFIDPDTRKNNAAFWRLNVGEKLSGKYRNIFDNVNTLVIKNYLGKGLNGEAVKINADTGVPEW